MPIKTLAMFLMLFFGLTAIAIGATETIHYTYDNSLQIIRTAYGNDIIADYTYDAVGNRLHRTINIGGGTPNNPPSVPFSPVPDNSSAGVNSQTALMWSAEDPDTGDEIIYDIYLGTNATPPLLKKGHNSNSIEPHRLLPLTTYYWKIVARDNHNAETEGPLWSFTTRNAPPSIPVRINPIQPTDISYSSAYLSWQSVDPDIGQDCLTSDIYFGPSDNPALIESGSSASTYALGSLSPNTTYYWKIIVRDCHGGEAHGPLWSFQTAAHEPVNIAGVISSDTTLTAIGGPYIVQAAINVNAGVTLTIEPGTIIKVKLGTYFKVSGKLLAQGTVDNPIIITSERDDSYGGDTNGDGNATRPENGDWQYLMFSNTADQSILS